MRKILNGINIQLQLLAHGNDNAKYFNMLANERYRKKHIVVLDQDEGRIGGGGSL